MARRSHFTEPLQTRLTRSDYEALLDSFKDTDLCESEMARSIIVEWLENRKKFSR